MIDVRYNKDEDTIEIKGLRSEVSLLLIGESKKWPELKHEIEICDFGHGIDLNPIDMEAVTEEPLKPVVRTRRMTFDTTAYRHSHGKEPRGEGNWAFSDAFAPGASDPIFWKNGTYSEAKKAARAYFNERTVITVIFVQP